MTTYREMFDFIITENIAGIKNAIDNGFNVNEPDQYGFLLVHRACANHQLEIVSLLIESASKLEVTASDLWTPMHLAAVSGALGCPTLLAKAGANPNVQDKHGQTPLHLSITSRRSELAVELVSLGAKKDIKNNKGLTAFELAKSEGASGFYGVLA